MNSKPKRDNENNENIERFKQLIYRYLLNGISLYFITQEYQNDKPRCFFISHNYNQFGSALI